MGETSGKVRVDPVAPLLLEVPAPPGGSIKVGDSTTDFTKKVHDSNASKTPCGKVKPSASSPDGLLVVASGVLVTGRDTREQVSQSHYSHTLMFYSLPLSVDNSYEQD